MIANGKIAFVVVVIEKGRGGLRNLGIGLALLWQKFTWVFDEAASAVRAMVGR
jgi:hypothetical protein